MTCRPFTFLILLAAICTFDSLLILKQCSPRISSHFRSSVKRSQAVKKTGATDISTPSYSRQNVHYCAACSTSFIGDEENLHTLRAMLNRKRKMVKNKFLGLEIFMRSLSKSSLFSSVKLPCFRTDTKPFGGILKKVRSAVSSTFLSFCLLCTFSLGNVAKARANQGISSQPEIASSRIKSNAKISGRQAISASSKCSDNHHSKTTRKVNVDIIIAQSSSSDVASKKKEKKSVTLAKQINRKSREVEKSLSNDLFEFEKEAEQEVKQSWDSLTGSMKGAKLDTLIMLVVTSAVIPIFKRLNLSPILGFLLMGTVLGPSCLHWIHDVHTIDMLGELGIVFFLFEMGLELSIARLNAMKKDVFGLGTMQFLLTSAAGCAVSMALGLPTSAAVTIGGSLALSSSAFVLQLLKDKNQMGTRAGKASFGILLLQDLAVVPLLVVVELLAKGGTGLGKALSIAGVKALVTLSVMSVMGKKLLDPIFYFVAKSSSHEAFLSIILTTVLLMSFVTQGIGLSNTLGAFLAGLLLAETKYRYQIESDIAPFRGLLLGFFFITVGFNIDLAMIVKEAPKISAMLAALIVGKASIITALSLAFGMSFANSQLSGLLLAQGGEFAFVALGIAERSGLIDRSLCKLLLTTVALSMASTPMLAELGGYISNRIEQEKGLTHYLGQDKDAEEMKADSKEFVFVAGYGRVGKMVCDMLDRMPVRYIALDSSPIKAIEARGKGLPVFYGDINRPEVLHNFNVGDAKACVFTIDDMTATNKAVINVRKMYPTLPLLVRAKNTEHQKRLENMFDDIYVMSPVLPEDSVLLTLPFGGAVLSSLGVSKPEVDAILEDFRKILIEEDKDFSDDTFDFLNSFKKKQPASAVAVAGDSIGASSGGMLGDEKDSRQNKVRTSEEQELMKIKELKDTEIPDYLDGSDVLSAPNIDYLDTGN